MADDNTLAQALANVRHQREALEVKYEQVSGELSKLRLAERSLASIVEGTTLNEPADVQPKRRRASTGDDQPRATRGPRGPRANSAKGRLKALLEGAGSQGLSHSEITERLPDVATNTLATYLSVMATSGELVRYGDSYHASTHSEKTGSHDSKIDDIKDLDHNLLDGDQSADTK